MQPGDKAKILLVEDDEAVAQALVAYLRDNDYDVEHESRGDAAVRRILDLQPALVLLDVNLPGKDGFDICQEIRPKYSGPVIVLTTRGNDLDHVLALEFGADDFISKPAPPRIVLAHVKALLRRVRMGADAGKKHSEYTYGALHIDRLTRTVTLKGVEVAFTAAEFDLLWLLASRAGDILSRNDIMTHLRGIGHDGLDRSIDMRVSRLRKLLDDDTLNPRRIKTVRGKGYLFSPAAWD